MAIRPTKQQQKTENNRLSLVNAARHLFSEHGYDNVTIDDICEYANLSKGSFYHVFHSKDDVLMAYASYDRDVYIQNAFTYDEDIPFEQQFRDFCFANFSYNKKFDHEFNRTTYKSYICINRHTHGNSYYQSMMRKLIERGLKEGKLKDGLSADLYYCMIHDWIIGFFLGWSLFPDEQLSINESYDLIMNVMVRKILS